MRFLNFNKQRFYYVLNNSVGNLFKEFYEKNDKKLRINKVSIRNIPKGPEKSNELFKTFPDNALKIAHEWFKTRISEDTDILFEDIIKDFIYHEFINLRINKETAKKYSIRIFINITSENPDEKIISLMQHPLFGEIVHSENKSVEQFNFNSFISKFTDSDIDLFSPPELYLSWALSNKKDKSRFEELFNKILMEQEVSYEPFETIFNDSLSPQKITNNNEFNIILSKSLNFVDDLDITNLKLIGMVKLAKDNGIRFVKIIAIFDSDGCVTLNNEQSRHLLPSSGDVIWFNKGHRKLLDVHQFGVFSISEGDNALDVKTNKYKVDQLVCQLHPILDINCNINDLSSLRMHIKSNENYIVNSKAYLRVNKQTILKPNFNMLGIDFDKPMDTIKSGDILEIDGAFFKESFSSLDIKTDLSEPSVLLKKLIRSHVLSKNNLEPEHIDAISKELTCINEGQTELKYIELIKYLEIALVNSELLNELIEDIYSSDVVKQLINKKVDEVVDLTKSQESELKRAIQVLEEKQTTLKLNIENQVLQQKNIKKNFSLELKNIFDRGVQDGAKKLAETAFFEAIFSKNLDNPNMNQVSVIEPKFDEQFHVINSISIEHKDSKVVSKLIGYTNLEISKFMSVINFLNSLGISIAFKGPRSRIFAKYVAQSLDYNLLNWVDIFPGLNYSKELAKFISNTHMNSNPLVLNNFDLSAISVYGSEILDYCYSSFLNGKFEFSGMLIFNFDQSGIGLPIPDSLNKSIAIIDTDAIDYLESKLDIDELMQSVFSQDTVLDLSVRNSMQILFKNLNKRFTNNIENDSKNLNYFLGALEVTYLNRFLLN